MLYLLFSLSPQPNIRDYKIPLILLMHKIMQGWTDYIEGLFYREHELEQALECLSLSN